MTFQDGVSFDDGIVSVDKLQKICQNDEYMYNDIINKPLGIIALGEKITTYQNAGTSQETVLSGVYVKPPTDNRLVMVHAWVPRYSLGVDTGNSGGNSLWVARDGKNVNTFFSPAHGSTTPSTSIYTCFFDVLKKQIQYQYKILSQTAAAAGRVVYTCSASNPMQLWIEDWGIYNGTFDI